MTYAVKTVENLFNGVDIWCGQQRYPMMMEINQ